MSESLVDRIPEMGLTYTQSMVKALESDVAYADYRLNEAIEALRVVAALPGFEPDEPYGKLVCAVLDREGYR